MWQLKWTFCFTYVYCLQVFLLFLFVAKLIKYNGIIGYMKRIVQAWEWDSFYVPLLILILWLNSPRVVLEIIQLPVINITILFFLNVQAHNFYLYPHSNLFGCRRNCLSRKWEYYVYQRDFMLVDVSYFLLTRFYCFNFFKFLIGLVVLHRDLFFNQTQKWLLFWNFIATFHIPWNVRSRSVLLGLPCYWTFKTMYSGWHVLWYVSNSKVIIYKCKVIWIYMFLVSCFLQDK